MNYFGLPLMIAFKYLSEVNQFVSEKYAFNTEISEIDKNSYAEFIVDRLSNVQSYSGLPAPFPEEVQNGIRLYTGELLKSPAAIKHISGEEALRSLKILDVKDEGITKKMNLSEQLMLETLNKSETDNKTIGRFCCGKCTVAFWRVLNVGGYNRQAERLEEGIPYLKSLRNEKNEWKRFPYFYTLSALNEMKFDLVEDEIKHASKLFESKKRRLPENDFGKRRLKILENLTDKLNQTINC